MKKLELDGDAKPVPPPEGGPTLEEHFRGLSREKMEAKLEKKMKKEMLNKTETKKKEGGA